MANPNKENFPHDDINPQNPGDEDQEQIRGQQKTPQRDTLSDEETNQPTSQPAKKGHQSGR